MDVRLPDGTVISGVPENITKAELASKLQKGGYNVPAAWLPKPEQSIASQVADKTVGLAEGVASLVSMIPAGIAGTASSLADPNVPFFLPAGTDPKVVQQVEGQVAKNAASAAKSFVYEPTTQSGQEVAQLGGEALQQLTPVLAALPGGQLPMIGLRGASLATNARGAIESVGRAAAGETGAINAARAIDATVGSIKNAGQTAGDVARNVTTLPRRAMDAITGGAQEARPTPGTLGSAGAAASDKAAQRVATAEQLGFTGDTALTKGQATRDSAQAKFETETAKMPVEGAPLRERLIAQNEQILRNMDNWIDQTGAEAPNLRAVGQSVDKALVQQSKADKAKVRAAYQAAEKAGELEAPVTLDSVVQHLNDSAPDAATAPLLNVARQRAIQLGIAAEENGQLIPQPTSLANAERFRQAVGRATDFEPTNIRQSTIIKSLVDDSTQSLGGTLYQQARKERARVAQNYEDRSVIAKLLTNKRGSSDRQVAFEDVFDHTMLRGSLDDVREARRVLQRSGEDGRQAWRDLQGQTLRWIKEQATKSIDTDSSGNRVVSPAGLRKAIESLDADGKLDTIFGKIGAQQLRDVNEIAQVVKTVPPEAAINRSNTAATLLTAFGDLALSGASGLPLPAATATRLMAQKIQDVKLKRRINDALNIADKKRQAAPTF